MTSGTGASGWARSVHLTCRSDLVLPGPEDPGIAFFVRKPWPSPATGASLVEGLVTNRTTLQVTSEMEERGVIFDDGIEQDFLAFGFGQRVEIRPATRTLNLLAA